MITLYINIIHAIPQARLDALGVPAEDIHDARPTQRREHGPGVVFNLVRELGVCDDAGSRLDGQFGERETHAREYVNDNLLRDRGDFASAWGALAEDEVAA
jgi:hypothetical protein